MPLPTPNLIKIIAAQHGYVERREEVSSTLFFKENEPNNPTLINVFYTTGGVMTKLSHPRSGYNELWRNDAYDSAESLTAIFANPRVHTGQGYRRAGGAKRGCIKCGAQKKKSEFSKNQWRKGAGNSKCSTCTQQGRNGQQSRGGDAGNNEIRPNDITWENITDAVTCDAEGCGKISPTIRCSCTAPVYYCSEGCKRRHRWVHSEECRDLEHFRSLASGEDPNINSGLCNASPTTSHQKRGYAMATQLSGRRTVETLLVQAEYIHQENENWNHALAIYKQILMMGGGGGENLTPPQCRQAFMGSGRCLYELGMYDKAIHAFMASLEMNRHFPHVHKYLALSHLASGNRDLAIKTMKEAVLYEAPWSDDTVRINKELLCELMNGGIPQGFMSTSSPVDPPSLLTAQPRIDVFYGRTDGTIGYKEYSTVVVKTTETETLQYFGDLYEPRSGCDYKVLFEVDMSYLPTLCRKAGVDEPNIVGWVKSPLKEVVLEYWKEKRPSGDGSQIVRGVSLFGVGG